MVQLSSDPDFHFEILRALAQATYGGADAGEVLTVAGQIQSGDFESFYSAFNNMANNVYQTALKIDACLFPTSVRDAMFKAANYFRSADFYLHSNPSDPRIDSLWDQQTMAFNKALSVLPVPGKRNNLKGENFTIPTIFYAPDASIKRRPTIIIGNGFDGSQEELYHMLGKAALERGYNVISYEGPGQPTPRRDQNIGFIVEWEQVVTPVVDYLFTQPEVDTSAIALAGISFGGFLAPRAAAFEHRLAAVICLDGLYDFGTAVLSQFDTSLTALFESGNQTAFDAVMNAVRADPSTSTQTKWFFDQGLWAFETLSPFDFITQIQAYTLDGIIDQIPGPVFVGDAQNDLFYQGQAQVLAAKLGNRSTYHEFLTADGAGEHSGIGSAILQNQVVYDWFQDIIDSKN
jgi:esterase/lipase